MYRNNLAAAVNALKTKDHKEYRVHTILIQKDFTDTKAENSDEAQYKIQANLSPGWTIERVEELNHE